MSWKLFIFLGMMLGLLLASCSPGIGPDETDWPDENDIATMISLTLTQRAEAGIQGTPQPAAEDSVSQGAVGAGETGDQSGEQGSVEDPSGDVGDEGQALPAEGSSGDEVAVEGGEQPETGAGIPGLNALDLVERLVGFGFDCPEPVDQVDIYERQCVFETAEYQFVVTIWGKTVDQVDLVEGTAFYFGDLDYTELTSVVFEMIAGMPYEGAMPEDAKGWVKVNLVEIQVIGDEAVSEFGGVRYALYALPSAQVLEIGQLQQ